MKTDKVQLGSWVKCYEFRLGVKLPDDDGLICAYRIERDGQAQALSPAELSDPVSDGTWVWIHFDVGGSSTREWLEECSGLDVHAVEALLAEETRPRASTSAQGSLVILRGVNLHPQSDPTDMISVRLWIEPNRIISTRIRRLLSVTALRERCDKNDAPGSVGEFVVDLNNGLIERMSGVINSLEEEIDELEQIAGLEAPTAVRPQLLAARQKIIPLRRFLSPQRDAISQLMASKAEWLADWQRGQLRECADRLTRYVEELDAMREKGAVIQDTVATLLSETMNRNMLILSVVAAIFLPLGLLTGLLGINVDGMPGSEKAPWAFWIVVALLVAITVFEIWLFRRLGLIGLPRTNDKT